jgi:hypothetical protein
LSDPVRELAGSLPGCPFPFGWPGKSFIRVAPTLTPLGTATDEFRLREWAEFWPGSNIQPFATFINGVTKYVATSAPLGRNIECRCPAKIRPR